MKKLFSTDNLLLLTIFCMPLYLVKAHILGVPSNMHELLILLAIGSSISTEKNNFFAHLPRLPKLFISSCILIVSGVILSIFSSNNIVVGLGILKSWFLLPMLFSYVLYLALESGLPVKKVFASIYASIIAVGIISITYKMLGITTYDARLSAFYLSPNHLAMYLSPGILFGSYFTSKSYLLTGISKKTFFQLFLFLLVLIALYFTYSYGAWLAVLISLLLTGIASAPHKKQLLAFLLFLFICGTLLFVSQKQSQKFESFQSLSSRSSLASRITIWQVSLRLTKDNTLFGVGPGNFQSSYLYMQKYYPPYLEWAVPQPHNIFLAFWLQSGLLGFAGFLALLFFIFHTLSKLVRNKKNAALAMPLLGFFIYTVSHGLIDTTYWKNDLSFLFWIIMVLSLFMCTNSTSSVFQNARVQKPERKNLPHA